MNDVIVVQILQYQQDAGNVEFCLVLCKPPPLANVVTQVSPIQIVHY